MANKLYHFHAIQAILNQIGIESSIANTIASASQAVDDFHEDKLIVFKSGKLFYPVVTAHRMLDMDNLDSRDASNIWMPFHFFPDDDCICRPESENVKKLIKYVKEYNYQSEMEKHLLHGILLHIYVDTYTHQNFIGLHCKHNDISDLDDKDVWDIIDYKRVTANLSPSIGHGEALTYPDDFWRNWSYRDNAGQTREMNNPDLFIDITKNVCKLMKELGYKITDLNNDQLKIYKEIYSIKGSTKEYEKEVASKLDEISLQFTTSVSDKSAESISYKKWKNKVMYKVQSKENKYIFKGVTEQDFLQSEWVKFQYLAKEVRTFFKREIFPNLIVHTTVY